MDKCVRNKIIMSENNKLKRFSFLKASNVRTVPVVSTGQHSLSKMSLYTYVQLSVFYYMVKFQPITPLLLIHNVMYSLTVHSIPSSKTVITR